jgi:two-component system, NarL family, nitrate/nitrite response regulator NarL
MILHVGARVLIVDDNRSFLTSARALLESEGLEVVGVVADGPGAAAALEVTHPDVVLVDVDLGRESGVSVTRELAAAHPQVCIILISAYPEVDLPGVLAQTPALGFIHKPAVSRRAIEGLLAGPR